MFTRDNHTLHTEYCHVLFDTGYTPSRVAESPETLLVPYNALVTSMTSSWIPYAVSHRTIHSRLNWNS